MKAKVLTHDPEERLKHERDELITHGISSGVLLDLYDTSTRLMPTPPPSACRRWF